MPKDTQNTYEVWIERIGQVWSRAKVDGEDLWGSREEAADAAGDLAEKPDVLQIVVMERRPILFVNGPAKAKSEKFKLVDPPRMIGNS